MIERLEAALALAMSVLGALTALLTVLRQVLSLRQQAPTAAPDTRLSDLEKDIVRLDALVQCQRRELQHLTQAREQH